MSIKSLLRVAATGLIIIVTATVGQVPANSAPSSPIELSTALTDPAPVSNFNGGFYFIANNGSTKDIYFYDGSGKPKPVVGGEDANWLRGKAIVFKQNLYFETRNHFYKITKGNKLKAEVVFADLGPSSLVVVNNVMYFIAADTAASLNATLYKWDGVAAPTSLANTPNLPNTVSGLLVAGNFLLAKNSDDDRYVFSSDMTKGRPLAFSPMAYKVDRDWYFPTEATGFVKLGDNIYGQVHEPEYGNYEVFSHSVFEGDVGNPERILSSNGNRVVNASTPKIFQGKLWIIGAEIIDGSAAFQTLWYLDSKNNQWVNPPAFRNQSDQLTISFSSAPEDHSFLLDRVLMVDPNTLELYQFKNNALTKIVYNGTTLHSLYGSASRDGKIIFGSTDPSAASGSAESSPVFTLDTKTDAITAVTLPVRLDSAVQAMDRIFLVARRDVEGETTLWIDEKPSSSGSTVHKVTGFYGDSSWINPVVASGLKAKATPAKGISAITCTGTTSGAKVTNFDKKLALARATAACAYLKKLAPAATIKVVAKPATGSAATNRAVLLEITR